MPSKHERNPRFTNKSKEEEEAQKKDDDEDGNPKTNTSKIWNQEELSLVFI
jgi:hypothetical protein